MVDTLSMLISHGMLLYVVWRLLNLRDPDERGATRFRPSGQGRE